MLRPLSPQDAREQLEEKTRQFTNDVLTWNEQHPNSTLKELEHFVHNKRRDLMSDVLEVCLKERDSGYDASGKICADCQRKMSYKGEADRNLETWEASITYQRAYYHCSHCKQGLFPPG
jgi:hypothetical protein